MDKTLFKDTYMNAMKILSTGKPIFVTISATEDLMIKKNILNSQTYIASWIIKGEPKFRKKMTYTELYDHISTLDPFNFRTAYNLDDNIIEIDFTKKRIV